MDSSFEQRLVALESAVAELQRQLSRQGPTSNWIERFTGSFKDEPAFEEVLKYGRAIRKGEMSVEACDEPTPIPVESVVNS